MNEMFPNMQGPEENGVKPAASEQDTSAATPEPTPAWQMPPVSPETVQPTEAPAAEPTPAWQMPPVSPKTVQPTQAPAVEPAPAWQAPVPPTQYADSTYTPPAYAQIPVQVRTSRRTTGSRNESPLTIVLAVLCSLSILACVWLGVYVATKEYGEGGEGTMQQTEEKEPLETEERPKLEISDLQEIDDGGLPTREIVDKNINATVVLTMYHKTSTVNYYSSFFGMYGGNGSNDSLTEVSAASGIIMSKDGYIITNSHCVFDEDYEMLYARLDVTLYDGRVFEGAKVIGYDRSTDLAVIKIEAEDLTPAEFGNSSQLALGDRVITLGNSGGLSWSVSQGILSGQARDVYEDTGYAIKCLQVDAVINPGSSGGPLINAYGQVVGVNSAKIVLSGHEGLGFSIPINEAKTIIDDLIENGYATGRVSIGIYGRTVTSIGYEGFIIEEFTEDSPLKDTKAAVGDIITHVNNKRVMNYEEMRTELTKGKVGQTVSLTLIRLDRQTRQVTEFTIDVKLGEMK